MNLFSGGANGSDYIWEKYTLKHLPNAPFTILSFSNHTLTTCNHGKVIRLPQEILNESDFYIKEIAQKLEKYYPSSDYVFNLIRRSFFIVLEAESIISIGTINENMETVDGGTGWTIEMAKMLDKDRIHVYDENRASWFVFDYQQNNFVEYEGTPIIEGNCALIGTREPRPYSVMEMEKVCCFSASRR